MPVVPEENARAAFGGFERAKPIRDFIQVPRQRIHEDSGFQLRNHHAAKRLAAFELPRQLEIDRRAPQQCIHEPPQWRRPDLHTHHEGLIALHFWKVDLAPPTRIGLKQELSR